MSSFTLTCFADEIADSLTDQIALLEELGIRYIEMRGVNGRPLIDHTLEEADAIKKTLDAHGLRLSAVGSSIGKIGIEDDFAPHLEKFKHTLEIARRMQAPYIRMFSFFIPKGENADAYKGAVLERYRAFEALARGSGVILLHENEKGIYGDTPARCRTLLDAMDFSVVRGIFDPANFVQCGADTLEGFELLKDKIVYLHIKDAVRGTNEVVPSGEGDGQIEEILRRLAQNDYVGFLSLEPHLQTGDIAVCGPEKFKRAYFALTDLLRKTGARIEA